MKISDALTGVLRLFLDTAPVIYYVEQNPHYSSLIDIVLNQIDAGDLTAITSPVTLAECLVVPYHMGNIPLQQAFIELVTTGRNTLFQPINDQTGIRAAALRARYNIRLPDSLQIASAIDAGCEAFLTNHVQLKRITELKVLVLDELTIS
ncbi:MAG: PIN domain-containing protein [Chloroflexi bacterium]|nr:PIN domain-containing protein [Chloroflexota bacterium]